MSNNVKVAAFQIDPLESLNIKTDSTILIALEMQKRGYTLFFYQVKNLYITNNQVMGKGYFVELCLSQTNYYTIKEERAINLSSSSVIMIRQNPPFDLNYITATYILDQITNQTLILNNPTVLRNFPEKFSSLIFKSYLIDSVITADFQIIYDFVKKHQQIVLKPLYQHGGQDVILVDTTIPNFEILISSHLTKFGHLIAQKFLDSVKTKGDKRVIFSLNKILGYFRRLPISGDFRSNTALGGSFEKCELTPKEQLLCGQIGDFLNQHNIVFAGIDLLEEKIVEINITSPTGLAFLNQLYSNAYEKVIVDAIETKINPCYKRLQR